MVAEKLTQTMAPGSKPHDQLFRYQHHYQHLMASGVMNFLQTSVVSSVKWGQSEGHLGWVVVRILLACVPHAQLCSGTSFQSLGPRSGMLEES